MEREEKSQPHCSVLEAQKSGEQPELGEPPQCEGIVSVDEKENQETGKEEGTNINSITSVLEMGIEETQQKEEGADINSLTSVMEMGVEKTQQKEEGTDINRLTSVFEIGVEETQQKDEVTDIITVRQELKEENMMGEVKTLQKKTVSKSRGKQRLVTQWFYRTKDIPSDKKAGFKDTTQDIQTVPNEEVSMEAVTAPSNTETVPSEDEKIEAVTATLEYDDSKYESRNQQFELNAEARETLEAALTGRGADEIVVNHGVQVTVSDMKTAKGKEWFGQTLVDAYYNILEQRSLLTPGLPRMKAVSTYFYRKLVDPTTEVSDLERWGGDMLSMDIILFPTLWSDHYNLVVWYVGSGEVHLLDSLRWSRKTTQVPVRIMEFIQRFCRRRNIKKNIIMRRCEVPVQPNGYDCGPYICSFAECISRKSKIQVRDMEYTRMKIASDIMQGRIQEESITRFQQKAGDTRVQQKAGDTALRKEVRVHQHKTGSTAARKVDQETLQCKTPAKPSSTAARKEDQKLPQSKTPKVRVKQERQHLESKRGEGEAKEAKKMEKDSVRERVMWPKANSKEWQKLEDTLAPILQNIGGTAQQRVENFPDIIYHFSLERFGAKAPVSKKQSSAGPSRRQRKCTQLRTELKNLKKAYFEATEKQKPAVEELQIQTRRELKLLRKAEAIRKNRKQGKELREKFTKEPFKVAKEILSDPIKGQLRSTKEEVEEFLKEAHSDSRREEKMEECDGLYEFPDPVVPFSMKEPSLGEIRQIVKKARSASAPGPNGVPYKVYKYCPQILRVLWSNLRGVWRSGKIPKTWRKAEGCLIPKEDGAQQIDKYRTISFLNCEGKVFFKYLSGGLTQYAVANKYIDQAIQKAGIPGVSGCLENTALISQLILEAKEKQKNLVSVWLDIAKAFLSMPHQLVMETLRRIKVPEEIQQMVESYYQGVYIRFSTGQFVTEWQRLEKGIVTGCTISVILFALSMTWLVKSVEKETKGPVMQSGVRQTNARLYMDDINTTAETVLQTRYLMLELGRFLSWARLDVKASKSRVLIIRKGKVDRQTVKIQGEAITSILDKPIKYLGKWFNHKLSDKEQVEEAAKLVEKYLQRIDRSHLPGKFKVWMVQNVMMPRIMWPLSLYDFTLTTVEAIQKRITMMIKKWLGFPRSLSEAVLYSTSSKLQLPCSSLVEEVKVTKARNKVTLEQSCDHNIRNAGVQFNTGRKWKVAEDVERAKSQLKLQEIAGIANIGREGVGLSKRIYYSKASKWEKRKLITQKVRENEEEQRRVKVVGMWKQGSWMKWPVEVRKISSQDLWRMNEASIKFLVKSVYDLLPTPANKNTWYKTEENKCVLCGGNATLNHILSSCKQALAQGRYTWRHNNVLRELAKVVETTRKEANGKKETQRTWINFTKEGSKPNIQARQLSSYWDNAKDWEMIVDVEQQLQIPKFITDTRARPDMIIFSRTAHCLGILELTVPYEDRMEVANELKRSKYEELKTACEANSWSVVIWPVEVGVRGFISPSLIHALKALGITGKKRKDCIKAMSSEAERSSRILWSMHRVPNWGRDQDKQQQV